MLAISAEIDNKISLPTVCRRLVQANLPGGIARKVPLMIKQNIKLRIQLAKGHLLWFGKEGEIYYGAMQRNRICLETNAKGMAGCRPKRKEFYIKFKKKIVKHGGGNMCVSFMGLVLVRYTELKIQCRQTITGTYGKC